ncbi:MAG: phenylacetate--CoA ligase, partial [Geobacter sp.]
MAWNKEETVSRSEMRAIQLARLKKTVGYVYDKNPVYKGMLDEVGVTPADIKSLDDIRRLPFTTKQTIRDNYPFNLFTASQEDIVEY